MKVDNVWEQAGLPESLPLALRMLLGGFALLAFAGRKKRKTEKDVFSGEPFCHTILSRTF